MDERRERGRRRKERVMMMMKKTWKTKRQQEAKNSDDVEQRAMENKKDRKKQSIMATDEERKMRRTRRQMLADMGSGALAESMCVAALFPMDTLKVRVQSSKLKRNASIRILKSVRASQLYQGFRTATVSAAVFGGLYIMFYERCREFLQEQRQHRQQRGRAVVSSSRQLSRQSHSVELKTKSPINCIVQHSKNFIDGLLAMPHNFSSSKWTDPAISCLFANTVTSWIEVPIDTIKQRMQAAGPPGKRKTPTTWWCASKAAISSIKPSLNIGGASSLYRAYWPFLLRTLPFEIIEFTVFESLRQATKKYNMFEAKKYEGAVFLSIGACAGMAATIVTMPIDNMKTRINVLGEGFFESFTTILRKYGVKGFFRGITPRLATHVPSGALYFAIYAISKSSLRTKLNVQDDSSEKGPFGESIKPKPQGGICEEMNSLQ